ncbi:YjcQ family protein [Peribacillus glennii]|uniref:YjcQ family protein n=1 Tax=Peribacillus glennii TaxID=2303991 RepID=UPI001314F096|nr:YjcQ family protein [Peribacillus glennii]
MNREKLCLAIINELAKGNKRFKHEDLDIELLEMNSAIHFLLRENYISYVDVYINGRYDLSTAEITLKGEQFLKENSQKMETYTGLKGIRDWVIN